MMEMPTGTRTSVGEKQNSEPELSECQQNQEHKCFRLLSWNCIFVPPIPPICLLQLSCLSWWWRHSASPVPSVSCISNSTHWAVLPPCWGMTKEWRSIALPTSSEWRLRLCSQDCRKAQSGMNPLMHTITLGKEDTQTDPTVPRTKT